MQKYKQKTMTILGFNLPPDSGEKLGLGKQTNAVKQTKTSEQKPMDILGYTLPTDSREKSNMHKQKTPSFVYPSL